MRSQEQSRRLNSSISNPSEQIEPRHSGHRNVEDETVKWTTNSGFQRCWTILALIDLEPEPAKVFRQQ
jgi:hypothetical protein